MMNAKIEQALDLDKIVELIGKYEIKKEDINKIIALYLDI